MIPSFRTVQFKGPFQQRGSGFAQLFSRLTRWLVPLVQKASPAIKNTLVEAGRAAIKNPEVKTAVKTVQDHVLAKGSALASRLLTGEATGNTPDADKIKAASSRVNAAVEEKGLSEKHGPVVLPKTAKITAKKRGSTLVSFAGKKKKTEQTWGTKKKGKKKKKKVSQRALF